MVYQKEQLVAIRTRNTIIVGVSVILEGILFFVIGILTACLNNSLNTMTADND